ncbi:hypothetical protein C1645_748650 [Glomus cerebriforme]|uniref:Concanavalin A-like lectin/glucanase domain-containing protein n=1 Tax=Glomus cerebriforme TaxID=658196 RepID=A0A397TKV6_9GLOM|nr:hypothetical protein C1645_748650 [Glomus cerebriforme]
MVILLSSYYYIFYLVTIIISNSLSVFCQKQDERTYRELITEPVVFVPDYNRVVNHAELPAVINELSITLKIYVTSHSSYDYVTVFFKGREQTNRTPSLWLKATDSTPRLGFSYTNNNNVELDINGYGFLTNRWYHIAYTLSDSEKRMNFYIDSKWIGSFSLSLVHNESVVFNDKPLYIGDHPVYWSGFAGQIRYCICGI